MTKKKEKPAAKKATKKATDNKFPSKKEWNSMTEAQRKEALKNFNFNVSD